MAVRLSPPVANSVHPTVPFLPQGETINTLDGSSVELAQLLQFCNNGQERVKELGVGLGDARPNSKTPTAFFFGAATSSVSE